MQTNRLEKIITDVIREQQLKLGFLEETIRLYYPLSTLNHFVEHACDISQMTEELQQFCDEVKERLGEVQIQHKGERFCIQIPPQGARYVHEHMGDTSFLQDLINTVQNHGCTMEQIDELFHRYSEHVCCMPLENGEFDCLYYFKNRAADGYVYCFKAEECHVIYHRFLKEDYMEMYGDELPIEM